MEFPQANSGEVRIGCTEPMAAGFVAAVIDRLSRQYPQIVFQLELCTTPAQQFHVLRERLPRQTERHKQ